MKIRAVRFVAFVMTLLCHVSSAQAASLGDLLGFKPGPDRTYTYNVTNSGQSQYKEAVQYQAPAHPITPAKRTQSVDARKQGSPGPAYQRPVPQTQSNPQQVSIIQATIKEESRSESCRQEQAPIGDNATPESAVERPRCICIPANLSISASQWVTARIRSIAGAAYYSNPYQSQYTPARNYYQGYSYNTWGSSGQACPPGRA